jgi:hypothetical protein
MPQEGASHAQRPAATGDPHAKLASPPTSGRARSQPAPEPDPARSATAAPTPADHHSIAPSRPTGAVDQAARDPQTTCNPIRPGRKVARPRRDPHGHRRAATDEKGPGGRTPAGRTVGPRTTEPADRTPDSWTSDGWTPDGWTTGPRPWEPDGWTPNGWTRGRRGTAWPAPWHSRPVATPDRWAPSASSTGQTPPGRSATRTGQQNGHWDTAEKA